MQTQPMETSLFELLGNTIKQLEKIEDDPKTLTFVARRLGNIVKHMKDLREDLQPRGAHSGNPRNAEMNDRPPHRVDTIR
jgi:hypothetical protein